jgi:hypothetical protein
MVMASDTYKMEFNFDRLATSYIESIDIINGRVPMSSQPYSHIEIPRAHTSTEMPNPPSRPY